MEMASDEEDVEEVEEDGVSDQEDILYDENEPDELVADINIDSVDTARLEEEVDELDDLNIDLEGEFDQALLNRVEGDSAFVPLGTEEDE